jgi:hypothetical protein
MHGVPNSWQPKSANPKQHHHDGLHKVAKLAGFEPRQIAACQVLI